ncbi:MAG: hypothetical protein JOY54_09055 [Acidobacteriaceae bacterium]|nr:hypothetical protein [Acidobacteriaceae bacterium]
MIRLFLLTRPWKYLYASVGLATALFFCQARPASARAPANPGGYWDDRGHGHDRGHDPDGQGDDQDPDPHREHMRSEPLPRFFAPRKEGWRHAREHLSDPQTMKLLVIAVDGTEPTYAAITAFLDQIGIPYDSYKSVCRLSSTPCPLPTFNTSPTNANYYGIVLTIGNLAYCNSSGTCQSTFSTADWAAMDSFTAAFGVRTLAYYTFPQPRYGLTFAGAAVSTTTTSPVNVTLTSGQALAKTTFSYLQPTASIPVENAYMYFATTEAATGETTVPVLSATYNGTTYTVGAIHTAATGQQYLALTMDNNPFLLHSLALNYGLFNWVTKGMFVGGRKIYLSPEVDDLFIDDDLFDAAIPQSCVPSGFQLDPTFDNAGQCPVVRISGSDLQTTANWETNLNNAAQTANFQLTLAFNGIGTVSTGGYEPPNDTLVDTASNISSSFFWVSHTYNHENLDCYDPVPNSGVCNEATQAQATTEITQNVNTANNDVGLNPFDAASMVTPNISGLGNPNFIAAAVANGLKYVVTDASQPGQKPPSANTGIPNAINPAVYEIPRYATNIFYNTDTSATGAAGSEPDEYNYFYGPNGISRVGGPGGPPFFSTNQTYSQIVANESMNLLLNMLRYYAFPSMFHQSNLFIYNGTTNLVIDTIQSTISQFEAISNLPITSLTEANIGALLQTRAAANASGVVAQWTPKTSTTGTGSITITVQNPATITMTGVNCPKTGATCETYGGQKISHLNLTTTPSVTVTSPQ